MATQFIEGFEDVSHLPSSVGSTKYAVGGVGGSLYFNGGQIAVDRSRGVAYFVDTNTGSNSNDGRSWGKAFLTMTYAFTQITAGDSIYFVGNVNEKCTTPLGAPNVSVIGATTRPRHADTHPLNGELSGATWKIGSLSDGPLCIVRTPGWRFENILFAAHADNYALRLDRNAIEDATEEDASHMEVVRNRFASGGGAISDTGGCVNILIQRNRFEALTTACILGVGNIGVGQSDWEVVDNTFDGFTNGVKIAAFGCRIQNNVFSDGGTPATTFVLNVSNGGGAGNFVIDNWFKGTTANFNSPDVVGNATDVWYNHALDTAAAGTSGVYEVGQPA